MGRRLPGKPHRRLTLPSPDSPALERQDRKSRSEAPASPRTPGASPGLRTSPQSTSISVITETVNRNGASCRSRAKSLIRLVSRRYLTKRHRHAVPVIRRDTIQTAACREYPATPGSAQPAWTAERLLVRPSAQRLRIARCRSRPASWPYCPVPSRFIIDIEVEVHGPPSRLYNLPQVIS